MVVSVDDVTVKFICGKPKANMLIIWVPIMLAGILLSACFPRLLAAHRREAHLVPVGAQCVNCGSLWRFVRRSRTVLKSFRGLLLGARREMRVDVHCERCRRTPETLLQGLRVGSAPHQQGRVRVPQIVEPDFEPYPLLSRGPSGGERAGVPGPASVKAGAVQLSLHSAHVQCRAYWDARAAAGLPRQGFPLSRVDLRCGLLLHVPGDVRPTLACPRRSYTTLGCTPGVAASWRGCAAGRGCGTPGQPS